MSRGNMGNPVIGGLSWWFFDTPPLLGEGGAFNTKGNSLFVRRNMYFS